MYHTTNIGQHESQTSDISTSGVDVDTISHAGGNKYESLCETTLNTDTITIQSNNYPIVYLIYQLVTRYNDISCLIKMPINIVPSTYSRNQI